MKHPVLFKFSAECEAKCIIVHLYGFFCGVFHRVSTALGYRAGRYNGDILESYPLNIDNGKYNLNVCVCVFACTYYGTSGSCALTQYKYCQQLSFSYFLCYCKQTDKTMSCFQQVTASVKAETLMITGEDISRSFSC